MKLASIFKYVIPFFCALALTACDTGTPNFEGTYGRMIDGKMTPRVKVFRNDSRLFASLYDIPNAKWGDPVEASSVTGKDYKPGWPSHEQLNSSAYQGIYAPGVVFLLAVPKDFKDYKNNTISTGYYAWLAIPDWSFPLIKLD